MQHYVYVLNKDGNPLMPTQRYGWVRRALKNGKAVVKQRLPSTIQLTYEPKTHEVQPVRLGIDPGRTNIGLAGVRDDGTCLYRANVETRNKEIPKLMGKRLTHRRASRHGERLARKRLAVKHHTMMKDGFVERKLPGYQDGVVKVKNIINTEAKFNNRVRPIGWLTPTVTQLLRTHMSCVEMVRKILPVSDVALEVNRFDFQRMENPHIKRWEYQKGPLHGYGSVEKSVFAMQNGVCFLCKKAPIEHYHHLIPKERRGSENVTNRAGLCLKCHAKVHTNPKATERLSKLKTGMNKKYHALSCINQMMKPFINWVEAEFPDHTYLIQGNDTKQYRERYNLDKDHNTDAYSVAATTMFSGACSCAHANALAGTQVCKSNRTNQNLTQGVACEEDAAANDFSPVSLDVTPDLNMPPVYFVKQYRCHDRANIKAQVYRTYKYDGKVVAKNRHPAYEAIVAKDGKIVQKKQKTPALDQWYEETKQKYGEAQARKMLSCLEVEKSSRRYNDRKRVLPGAVIVYKGKRYIRSGQLTNGAYFRVYGDDSWNIPASDCHVIPCTGLVYVS